MFVANEQKVDTNFYDEEYEVGYIDKSENKRIKVTVGLKNGDKFVNIREWYSTAMGEWRPGKAGMTIRYIDAMSLIHGIDAAIKKLEVI